MKKLKNILMALLTTVLVGALISCSATEKIGTGTDIFEDEISNQITTAYEFPDYDSKEYDGLDYLEKRALCQIPEDILKRMITEALIETYLQYPFFLGWGETEYEEFQQTIQKFNGLQELIVRSDIGEKIYNIYKNIDLVEFVRLKDGSGSMRVKFFEFLIAQDIILDNMNQKIRADLTNTCLEKIEEKSKYPNSYTVASTLLIMARIKVRDNAEFAKYAEKNELLSYFIETGDRLAALTVEELEEILETEDFSEIMNQTSNGADTTTEPIQFNETLEKYYDYADKNPQIIMLLGDETEFTDNNIAPFVVEVIEGTYDDNFQTGYSKELFDQISEKYFGRKLENYNNNFTYLTPEGRITATGWDHVKIIMILKDLEESPDGIKTGRFYTLFYQDDPDWSPEEKRNDFLSGNFDINHEYYPIKLSEMKFIEKYDENGEMYFQFISFKKGNIITEDEIQTATPYGS